MADKKMYIVLDDVSYCGSILEPGARCDFKALKENEVINLIKNGVIIEENKYQETNIDQDEITAKAEKIIEDANKQAEEIINNAKAEAEKLNPKKDK